MGESGSVLLAEQQGSLTGEARLAIGGTPIAASHKLTLE
jgi:hypothetical protein